MSSQVEQSQQIRSCSIHPSLGFTFICIDPNTTDFIFKCDFCVAEQTLMGKHLLPIKQIKDSDTKTIFYNWPFFRQDLVTDLKEIIRKPSQGQRYRDDIASYFKDLRIQILQKIDEMQLQMEQKAHNLSDFSNQIISKYNNFSSKEILKNTVINSSENLNDLSLRIRTIVKEADKNKSNNEKVLREMINKAHIQERTISLEGPNQIKKEILARLDKIDMFQIDPHYLSSLPVYEQQRDQKQNVEVLFELISNRLNFTSSAFQTKLKSHLENIKVILNRINFENIYEEGREELNLDLLDDKEVKEVSRFIQVLTQSKKKRQQQENQEQERSIQVEDVVKFVGNFMNFASEEMCSQVQRMLQNISIYVNSFKVKSVFKQGAEVIDLRDLSYPKAKNLGEILQSLKSLLSQQEPNNENRLGELAHVANQIAKGRNQIEGKKYWHFKQLLVQLNHPANKVNVLQLEQLNIQLEGIKFYINSFEQNDEEPKPMDWARLTKDQINSLEELANLIQTLNQKFGDLYSNAISPHPDMVHSQFVIKQLLPLLTEKEEQNTQLMLTRYPIFEMIPVPLFKQIQWEFIKTNFRDSQELELQLIQNGVNIIHKKDNTGSIVTNSTLDNNLSYSLICKFNKPFYGSTVCIGLILEDKIHSEHIGQRNYNSVYISYLSYTFKDLIKGDHLNSDKLLKQTTEMEFRFCIAEKKFYYSDSTYQNINKVIPEHINPKAKYRFGIGFQGGSDCCVSFSNVKIIKNSIDQF